MDLNEPEESHHPLPKLNECRKINKSVPGQTVPRHDMVTARAISRLSHSVAQLSASTNNNMSPNTTGTRCISRNKAAKQNPNNQNVSHGDITLSGVYNAKPNTMHSVREDGLKKAVTGSKRKWESDGRGSHMAMDVDPHVVTEEAVVGRSKPSATQLTGQSVSTSSNRSAQSPNSFMCLSAETDHYSSCSSMLSLSASCSSSSSSSPSNHSRSGRDHSSDENEADGEGDGEESGPQSRYTSPAHSRTSISPFGAPGSHKSSQTNSSTTTNAKRLPRVPRSSVCGGDSSDGLSVNMKIPRLTHWPSPSPDATSVILSHKSHGAPRRLDVYGRGTNAQGSLCGCNRGLRQHRLQLRRDKSDSMLVDALDHMVGAAGSCRHVRRNSASSSSRLCVLCRGTKSSTSSSSSCSPSSPSCPNQRQGSPESCEDLANDEQSDFPADEFLPPHNRASSSNFNVVRPSGAHRGTVGSRSDRLLGHSRRSMLAPSWRRDSASIIAPGSPDPNEMDSELEEIVQGTWPLLSHRARLGYLEGVARAGIRGGKRSPLLDAAGPEARRIDFVPSKLGEVQVNGTHSHAATSVDNRKMPTPPWIRANEDAPVPCSDDANTQNMDLDTNGNASRAGLGSRAPFESLAEPIPQTNTGHKLLQKLGWQPGTGLGPGCQGILNPVGCAKFAQMRPS